MTDLSIKNLSYVDNFKHTVMGNFANFKGRASRSEYWRFYGITIVIAGIINVLSALFYGHCISKRFWSYFHGIQRCNFVAFHWSWRSSFT